MDGLLARVSREFRREAERPFTPGTYTVRLLTVGDRVRLPEPVTSVTSVTDAEGDDVDYVLDGQDLVLETSGRPLWSGVPITVTYTHSDEVPEDVVSAVASIVARHLTVDPTSAEAMSTDLSTLDFRQRMAPWVSERLLLTGEERAEARSYRYPGSAVIIQKP